MSVGDAGRAGSLDPSIARKPLMVQPVRGAEPSIASRVEIASRRRGKHHRRPQTGRPPRTRNNKTFLIEIETGGGNVQQNIKKCEGHGEMIVFLTNHPVYDDERKQIPDNIRVLTPETIGQLHTILK